MRTTRALTILALVFLAFAAADQLGFAQQAPGKLVAVLELNNKAGITDDEAYFLTNNVRNVASQMLPPGKFVIMTRENIDMLLPPGMDLKKCTDAKCEVELGRKLGAEYIVTGEILRFGGDLRIQMNAHHVPSGHFLGSRNTAAAQLGAQEPLLTAAAREIMGLVLNHAGVAVPAQPGGGAVFVQPTQPTPTGVAELREIKPTEAPPTGASGPAGLYITSNPSGARVFLGDTEVATTSPAFQRTNLQAGTTVRVTLKLDLYHDLSFDVALVPGIQKFENLQLKPAFGSLTIESEPTGAKVLIGGREVGTTPYSNPRQPSGNFVVSLEKEWYAPLQDQPIAVRDGEATKQSFKLSQDFGTLEVSSNPSGAEVTLNGKKLGATPASFRVPPVKNGKLEVTLQTYRGKTFEISIDRGQTVKITAEQATLTAKVGALQVFAEPPEPGAKVFLDGKEVGSAPLTLEKIQEGRHEVKVETKDKAGSTAVTVAEAQTAVATVKLQNRGGGGMVRIEAGTFAMGSPSSEPKRDNDETPHTVRISRPFLLAATEVTQGQWQKVMGNNPSKFSSCGADCPVEQVSWNEAIEFCNKLSDQEGLSRCYNGTEWNRSCTGYRLPTEAEWEYAARAGTTSAFNTGQCLSTDQANYDGNYPQEGCPKGQYRQRPVKVGSFPPNQWGLYEMHGNVWEWVWDWKGDYPSGSVTDPAGPASGSFRVFRGGSWRDFAQFCRSAYRGNNAPGTRDNDVGFRVARSLP